MACGEEACGQPAAKSEKDAPGNHVMSQICILHLEKLRK
jgi:hypothetical protein